MKQVFIAKAGLSKMQWLWLILSQLYYLAARWSAVVKWIMNPWNWLSVTFIILMERQVRSGLTTSHANKSTKAMFLTQFVWKSNYWNEERDTCKSVHKGKDQSAKTAKEKGDISEAWLGKALRRGDILGWSLSREQWALGHQGGEDAVAQAEGTVNQWRNECING